MRAGRPAFSFRDRPCRDSSSRAMREETETSLVPSPRASAVRLFEPETEIGRRVDARTDLYAYDVVARTLERNPEKRYATPAEVPAGLEAEIAPETTWRRGRLRRTLAIAASVAHLVVGGA